MFLFSISCQDFNWNFLRYDPSLTFEVLTALNIKVTVFWDVMSHSQIDTSCRHLTLTVKMESVRSSKMLASVHQTTQRHIREDGP
jgi:hypothetical protein